MFKRILFFLMTLVLALISYLWVQPNDFRITRAAAISAPAEVIFAQINALNKWNAWSPWAAMDPNAKTTFSGPASGEGSSMQWQSAKDEVGAGTMTIVKSRPSGYIQFKLDMTSPMSASNLVDFTLEPEGAQTTVIWSMRGKVDFLGKVMGLFYDCDQMVGTHFTQGLANLKKIAEANKAATLEAQPASESSIEPAAGALEAQPAQPVEAPQAAPEMAPATAPDAPQEAPATQQ